MIESGAADNMIPSGQNQPSSDNQDKKINDVGMVRFESSNAITGSKDGHKN